MDSSNAYKILQYEHEVLWALYEIRDHHLKKIGERIYDDIGQILSLVRIQLCQTGYEPDVTKEAASEPGDLVGKAIRGLRDMHRSFYPETELLAKVGLVRTLEYELELLGVQKAEDRINVQGTPQDLSNGTQLIVFRMLQELLFSMVEQKKQTPVQIVMVYETAFLRFVMEYTGNDSAWDDTNVKLANTTGLNRLSLAKRAELIGGALCSKRPEDDKTQITLTVPFKTAVYDQ